MYSYTKKMSQKEESSIWLLSILAALNLAAQCNTDSFVINTASVLEWQAGLCACFLDLGLFDFHLSHSHKARCVDNAGQGEDFKAKSSPQGSVGSPQKGAVPLVRPISGSFAALLGEVGERVWWWEEWNPFMILWITPEISWENLHAATSPISLDSPWEEAAKKHWGHRKPSSWLYTDKQWGPSSRICHGKSGRKAMPFNCFSRPPSLSEFSPIINNVHQWFTRSHTLAPELEVLQGAAEGAEGLRLRKRELRRILIALDGACSVVGVGLSHQVASDRMRGNGFKERFRFNIQFFFSQKRM